MTRRFVLAVVGVGFLAAACSSQGYEVHGGDVGDHPKQYARTHPPNCVYVEWYEQGAIQTTNWPMGLYCKQEPPR